MAGESRTDILAWVNELLQLNYTKIEMLGTGAAYTQIMDSIFLDVPLTKLKMTAKHEYEYVQNFKVLQNVFKNHKVDKPIPVERLIRCKMQDNLEFAQWMKKYWDMHYPGGEYDAPGRRKGVPAEPNPLIASSSGLSRSTAAKSPTGTTASSTGGATRMAAKRTAAPAPRTTTKTADNSQALQFLTSQVDEMKLNVDGLEKERDFYFNKLREIEISVMARLEGESELTQEESDHLESLRAVLYSTEDGFEIPGDEEGVPDDEETF